MLARLVLQHVDAAERAALVLTTLDLLQPGGLFIAVDSDWGMSDIIQPELPQWLRLNELFNEWVFLACGGSVLMFCILVCC